MDEEIIVRLMARALARAGLSTAYGHCSMRVAGDEPAFLVCAPKPMGLIKPGEHGNIVPVDGPLPDQVLGEVRVHQQIYRRRPNIAAICRFISPNILALAAMGRTPKARHGFGSYFFPQVPIWAGVSLARTDAAASAIADAMAESSAVVMGVNGAVTAAETPERALTLAWCLEDAARIELAVLACGMEGNARLLQAEEAKERATWAGGVAERMWAYLTHSDPEVS